MVVEDLIDGIMVDPCIAGGDQRAFIEIQRGDRRRRCERRHRCPKLDGAIVPVPFFTERQHGPARVPDPPVRNDPPPSAHRQRLEVRVIDLGSRGPEIDMFILTCTALASLTLVFAAGTCAEAAAWCAYYSDNAGTNCGFYTIQQCQAATSGGGGYCAPNPEVLDPPPAVTRRRAR